MQRFKDYLNTTPDLVGWMIKRVVYWPIVLLRAAIIGAVLGLWLVNGVRVGSLVSKALTRMESTSSKKGTPSTNRSLRKLIDEIDDVRVRVSEHKKQKPEPWRFRIYKIDGEYRRACSPPNTTTCG